MITGHKLQYGEYDQSPLSTDEIWQEISVLFSSRSKNSTSYKFGFFKSILDNLYNVDENLNLTFDQLFSKFAEIYWNLVTKYKVSQMPPGTKSSKIETVLFEFVAVQNIVEGIPFESLSDEQKIELTRQVKRECKENVVGALYGDTGGIFYSFDKKEEWLRFNPIVYKYVCKRKSALEKLNYYEWAKYLEKISTDETTNNLLSKLDESSKRSNLSIYRQILFDEFESRQCFYCGKKLREGYIQVDHFIPWAFIKDDKLWNMVLACSSCNNKKRDKLAPQYFLERLKVRNNDILSHYRAGIQKYSQTIDIRGSQDMKYYRSEGLGSIYLFAQENGYNEIWTPPEV